MKIVKTVNDLTHSLAACDGTIGLVPTMGALHAGHLSLVERARQTTDNVVVSIFVNPTQFNDPNDLAKYPRTLQADCELLAAAGVDIVFAPTVDEVYPESQATNKTEFDFGQLDSVMEGAHRPGHFAGVAQVVSRLFDLANPDFAFFGEKDFQQLAIIRSMEQQRAGRTTIIGCPIIRHADGLAMSSRNTLLDSDHRDAAPHIYKVLSNMVESGGDPREIERQATIEIEKNPLLKVEYIEIVDKDSLQKIDRITKNAQLCAAVYCGSVRLIDNISF